ncbi:autoinducer binding domain-containing protein [Burkholderia pseudomultivorans]|uniref:Transcriptional activator protein LasR n=1 Tax=Burkholderia pseudomultivorans TaxID=1207504 RepID=A0ABU2E4B3_9BURK|nr:autoinducer binding domain-containing protein [Burkholderia pseudomultivorans]MDR8725744.1 Transcriptional activator protein LasR [Burkholderia pseudomultivorans]MDR8733201.1 Transcriptional activator protein LasR [Burkholderia pseudomultivorans]MDR8742854.1 Transcriptional activator protein LasR [Burkholderia pseudomultivorans]MDR8754706.1 Transcriptional activator protein LasR [Burkholderia pseudomultivorans]MDR8776174.1 Transcriptional activator protein LasR [Burkholderia pseudomultivora
MVSPLYTFEGLLTARSHAEIAAFLERHAGNLGYGRFFYSPLLVAGDARHFFKDDHNVVEAEKLYTKNIFTTYPASWIRRYQEAGHVAADPVVKLITTSNLPIHWDADDLQAARSRVFDEAREHGLATGITIPINGFDHTRALFSVTSDQAPEGSQRHTDAISGLAVLTALHLHEAVRRLDASMSSAPIPSLTSREKECLQWAAVGKTSWEIAHILSVSERTVIFHIGNATKKVGATNRRQAVARAISLRLIAP